MMTLTPTRRPEDRAERRRRSERTGPGTGLQVAWVGFLAYSIVMSILYPDHPLPPRWVVAILDVLTPVLLATVGGILFRRRWALWGSVVLALPVAMLAAFCVLANVGTHWVGEMAFAAAIVGCTLHPASWRMHAR